MEIKRDAYLNALIRKKDNGRVKIITGIRRCGKSYLLFNLYKNYLLRNGVREDQIVEIALDEIDSVRYRNPFALNEFVKEKIAKDRPGVRFYRRNPALRERSESIPRRPERKSYFYRHGSRLDENQESRPLRIREQFENAHPGSPDPVPGPGR